MDDVGPRTRVPGFAVLARVLRECGACFRRAIARAVLPAELAPLSTSDDRTQHLGDAYARDAGPQAHPATHVDGLGATVRGRRLGRIVRCLVERLSR